jgi:hypothetical protein
MIVQLKVAETVAGAVDSLVLAWVWVMGVDFHMTMGS